MLNNSKFIVVGYLIVSAITCLVACRLNYAIQSEIATKTPVSTDQPPLKTPLATPTTPPTVTPTTTSETGIPFILSQIHLGTPVVDALVNPVSNQLYLIDTKGQFRILSLTDYEEIASFETGFQVSSDYIYSLNAYSNRLLSLDPKRNQLYISGVPIMILDTSSQTVTDKSDISGEVTVDPNTNQLYLTIPGGDGDENCGVRIINIETWAKDNTILYPLGTKDPPPIMGACFGATFLDVNNQILYAMGRLCSGGSSCGSLMASVFNVSEIPEYMDSTGGDALVFDPMRNRFFTAGSGGYKEYHLSRYEIQGQEITRTLRVSVSNDWRRFLYDPVHDRLYGEPKFEDGVGSIFDGDLNLLMEADFPGILLTLDSKNQIIYTSDETGNLFILSTGFSPE
jgi:hypothetical protein